MSPRWDTGLQYFPSQYAREILGPRPEEDLRGRHRSRLFKTTSTPGEVLGDGRYSNQCAWKGTRLQYFNMGKAAADLSSEEALARRACFGGTKIFSSNYPCFFSLEQRPDPSSFRQASRHTDPTKLPPSSAKTSVTLVACPLVSHRSRMLLPPGSELGKFGPCRPSEGPRCDSLENVEQDRRAKSHRRCRTSQEVRGTKYHSRYPFRSSRTSSLRSLEPIGRGLRRS